MQKKRWRKPPFFICYNVELDKEDSPAGLGFEAGDLGGGFYGVGGLGAGGAEGQLNGGGGVAFVDDGVQDFVVDDFYAHRVDDFGNLFAFGFIDVGVAQGLHHVVFLRGFIEAFDGFFGAVVAASAQRQCKNCSECECSFLHGIQSVMFILVEIIICKNTKIIHYG